MKKVLEYCVDSWYSIFRIGCKKGVLEMKQNNITVFDIANFFSSKEEMTH